MNSQHQYSLPSEPLSLDEDQKSSKARSFVAPSPDHAFGVAGRSYAYEGAPGQPGDKLGIYTLRPTLENGLATAGQLGLIARMVCTAHGVAFLANQRSCAAKATSLQGAKREPAAFYSPPYTHRAHLGILLCAQTGRSLAMTGRLDSRHQEA